MTDQLAKSYGLTSQTSDKGLRAFDLFLAGTHTPLYMMGEAKSSCLETSGVSPLSGAVDTQISDMAQLRQEAKKNFAGGCQATVLVAYCDSLGKDDPDQVNDHTAKAINKGEQ